MYFQDDVPTGVICLDDYGACSVVDDTKRKYRFNLHNNDKSTVRVFKFFSDNQKECLQWVSAIEQVIKVCIFIFISYDFIILNFELYPFILKRHQNQIIQKQRLFKENQNVKIL